MSAYPLGPDRTVCVFAASSSKIDQYWFTEAEALGATLGDLGLGLSYGGCDLSLMGASARACRVHGGPTLGVIPQSLMDMGEGDAACTELITVPNLSTRKAVLLERSGVFVALPGGLGTLDEIFEVLAERQMGAHKKPIILVNSRGFYKPLLDWIAVMESQSFVRRSVHGALLVADDAAAAAHMAADLLRSGAQA